jgi:hypothetical protein
MTIEAIDEIQPPLISSSSQSQSIHPLSQQPQLHVAENNSVSKAAVSTVDTATNEQPMQRKEEGGEGSKDSTDSKKSSDISATDSSDDAILKILNTNESVQVSHVPSSSLSLSSEPRQLKENNAEMNVEIGGGGASAVKRYNGTLDCAQTILRDRGYAGPFQGIGATIARNIVGVTAYFYFYEYARLVMAGEKPVTSLGFLETMLAGGIGGVGYWVLCYPLDIVKTAVQCDSIYPEQRKYKGAIDAFSKLYAEGGVKRFSAGLSPALMRSFPANAVGFAIYESVKSSCEKAGLS